MKMLSEKSNLHVKYMLLFGNIQSTLQLENSWDANYTVWIKKKPDVALYFSDPPEFTSFIKQVYVM